MNENEISSLLEDLGLTEYEAKTISALFKLREAEAPSISRMAQVPKTRVYDVLERLAKRNLIIEITGRPKKYRVLDPEKVFSDLIGKKVEEIEHLKHRAEATKDFVVSENGFTKVASERVMKVKDRMDFIRIAAQEIGSAESSILGFTNLSDDYTVLKEPIKGASKKNVEVRLIAKIAGSNLLKEMATEGVKMRNFDHGMHAYIIDGKKVVLALSNIDEERPEYHFTIWRDNPTMVAALRSYFNECWGRGRAAKQ